MTDPISPLQRFSFEIVHEVSMEKGDEFTPNIGGFSDLMYTLRNKKFISSDKIDHDKWTERFWNIVKVVFDKVTPEGWNVFQVTFDDGTVAKVVLKNVRAA